MEKKRPGKVACESCRRQKIRCDCESPCSNCKKSGRLCSYSPHRKRGPVPRSMGTHEADAEACSLFDGEIPAGGKASLAHLVNYYFTVFFGRVCNIFEIPKEIVPSDPTQLQASMPPARKFSLMASLACCSRCAGNAELATKLYEIARSLSRLFYDDENLEEPETVAFGFAQMAVYASATDPRRAQKYNYLSQVIFQQVPKNESKRISMQVFLTLLWEMTQPAKSAVSLSFPLGQSPSGNVMLPPQRPFPMLMTESYSIISLGEPCGFVNPFVPRWFFDHENEQGLMEPLTPEQHTVASFEFVSFLRILLSAYFPGMGSLITEIVVKEEFFQMATGVIPTELVDTLVAKANLVSRTTAATKREISTVYMLLFLAPFLHSVGRIPEAHSRVLEATVDCQNVETHDMILLSPAPISVPAMLIGCWLLLQVHDLDTFDVLAGFLRHFSDIGYLNAKTGLKVLLDLKDRTVAQLNVHYTPFNPEHLHGGPKTLRGASCPQPGRHSSGSPEDCSDSRQYNHSYPSGVSPLSLPAGSELDALAAGRDIHGHLRTSLSLHDQMEQGDVPLETIDVFSSYLNPENDKGVFGELEYLMKQGGQFDFGSR